MFCVFGFTLCACGLELWSKCVLVSPSSFVFLCSGFLCSLQIKEELGHCLALEIISQEELLGVEVRGLKT